MNAPTRTGYHHLRAPWQPTPAQQRVLDRLVDGAPNAAIAQTLGISPETVKSHLATLMAEAGCSDRVELADWWRHHQGAPRPRALIRSVALVLAIAALALAVAVIVAGVFVLLLEPNGGRLRASSARSVVAPRSATAPAPEGSPPLPATDLPDPASGPGGNGPAVFLWQRPLDPATGPVAP